MIARLIFRNLLAVLLSASFSGSTVYATVITADASGEYQVEEVKDFRQRGPQNPKPSPEITNTSLDLDRTSEPFIARVIPSPESLKAAKLETKLTLPSEGILGTTETSKIVTPPAGAYEAIIRQAALKNPHLDAALIKAVISVESNYNTTAVSHKGAMGLMQLMPETAERQGVTNPFDPVENIHAGARELNLLMEKNSNISLALAAYNAGQGAVTKHKGIPPYKETQDYVVKVLTKTFHNRRNLLTNPKPATEAKVDTEKNEKLRPMKVYSYDW